MKRAVALTLAAAFTATASAHSVKELETALGKKEEFFQPLDRAAPDFALADAQGNAVRLADFHGKVVVLNFIYASCPDVCPVHSELIADLQAKVNPTPMKERVQFVSVTTDPAKDSPEAMRAYGPAHGLDPANWIFLTAASGQREDATRKLAATYGHKFSATPEGTQVHGVVTHVIDKTGRWRANFHGLKFDPVNLVLFVNALVNDAARPHAHPSRGLRERVKEFLGM